MKSVTSVNDKEVKIVAITQARFSSSRLPGKVLKKLGKETVLDLHLRRIKKSKLLTSFMVATTHEFEAEEIKKIAERQGFSFYQGDTLDVLDRFYQAARETNAEYIVRLTSDCPLIDPGFIDDVIEKFLNGNVDYASNCLTPTLPDGMDVEIFTFKSLEDAWRNALLKSEREHVTPYIRDCGKYRLLSVEYPMHWEQLRMTLDTAEDYAFLSALVENCGEDCSLLDYVNFLDKNPDIKKINSNSGRNEGYTK